MNIYVQFALTGKRLDLKIKNDDTVEELKSNIENLENIPITKQKLIFCSKVLEDTQRLLECGVCDNSVIQLVLRSESLGIPSTLPPQVVPRQYFSDSMLLRHGTPVTPRTPITPSASPRTMTPITPKLSPGSLHLPGAKISPSECLSPSEFKRKNGPYKLLASGSKSYCLCTIYISEFKDESKNVDYYRLSYTWEYATSDKSDARDCCWCTLNNNVTGIKNAGNPFIATGLEMKMSGLTIEKNDLSTTLINFLVMEDNELEQNITYQHGYNYRKNIMIALSNLNRIW